MVTYRVFRGQFRVDWRRRASLCFVAPTERAVVTSELVQKVSTRHPLQAWQHSAREWLLSAGVQLPALSEEEFAAPEIGVIGLSGMGKSALLNALVSPGTQLLPSGGIGPLTGLATRIVSGTATSFTVKYVGRAWVHDALRRLQAQCLTNAEFGRLSYLCTGDQYRTRDAEWLTIALHHALHPDSRRAPDEEDQTRASLQTLSRVMQKLGTSSSYDHDVNPAVFFAALREHASGQLAPLCESLEVSTNTPFLREGITLVDLPGVGAVLDSHAALTRSFLTSASAVLLVADRAGLTDSVVDALRQSAFLERWLSGDAELVVAVTKLDLVADDARRADRGRQKWSTYFFETAAAARSLLQQQMDLAVKQYVKERAPRALQVVPVSSEEMHRQAAEHDAPRRLRTAEATGIPELRRALIAMTRRAATRWARDVDQIIGPNFGERIRQEWLLLLEHEGPT